MTFAERCARDALEALRRGRKGSKVLGRGDLLLGLARSGPSRAGRLLGALGVEPDALADAVGGVRGPPADEGVMSPQLVLAIDFGAVEAALEGCGEIDSAHLLVALARGTRAGHDVWREPVFAAARIASAWPDGRVSVWDLVNDRGPLTVDAGRPVHCVTADRAWRHVAAGGDDGRIDLWDLERDVHVRFPDGHQGPVRAIAWSPSSPRLLTGSDDGIARVWDTERGTVVCELAGHDGPVRTVACNPQGELFYTGSEDTTIKVWSARSGRLVDTLDGHASSVVRLGFVQPGLPLVSRSADDEAILWTDPPQRHHAPEDELAAVFARFALTADGLRERLASVR